MKHVFSTLLLLASSLLVACNAENPTRPPVSGGALMCTQEAKQCPDGSYVGRSGPNCAFAACPQTVKRPITPQPVRPYPPIVQEPILQDGDDSACPQDVKQCPDGSFVPRTGASCEFTNCPQ